MDQLEPSGSSTKPAISPVIKVTHSAFVGVLVPIYWRQYGPGNFLWFSDIALLTSVPALWLESRLLASTQAVGVLIPEALWTIDFSAGLITRRTPIRLAAYMFDARIPLPVRLLSLFHLWLTPILLLIVSRRGYDCRAFRYQSVCSWVVLLASWQWTRPEENVNWVYSWRERFRSRRGRAGFLVLLMAAFPLAFHLPAHLLLQRLFPPTDPCRGTSRS